MTFRSHPRIDGTRCQADGSKIAPSFTIQPRLVCNNGTVNPGGFAQLMTRDGSRRCFAAICAWRGCAADNTIPEQPAMYLNMAAAGRQARRRWLPPR